MIVALGKKTFFVVLGLILLSGAVAVQRCYDGRFLSSEQSVRELLYFPSSRVVKLLSAGNELMVADFLWLRMIQYYAFHMRADQNYEYLYPITDKLTDLDPKFLYPYTFGSLLLVHDARDSVNSLKLLDKAKRNNPDRWEFPYMKGFILFVFLRRGEKALEEFLQASKLPNAWEGAMRYAAYISKREGYLQTAKQMWWELYEKSISRQEREVARVNMLKIDIELELERLQSLAAEYRRTRGRWPGGLGDLTAAGLSGPIGPDSLGGSFYWSSADSLVRNTIHDKSLKIYGK